VVQFRLEPSATGSKVVIDTDLNLSGSVAQYGRSAGMVQTIAAQLIGQFAKALEKKIAQSASQVVEASISSSSSDELNPSPKPSTAFEPPAKPIGGFSLLMGAILAALKGIFRGKNESK
jgi:hypothetical protein